MAGRMKTWRTLRLLILLSLVSLTELFEVRDDEWEDLSPDIAALHRLRGLAEHMFHERPENPRNQRDTSIHGARVGRSSSMEDNDKNPMSLLDQEDDNFTASVIKRKEDLERFLADISDHKIDDLLIGAQEIFHSYSKKLLVMTDKEKSTNDNVQQEYSLDPDHSFIVSKECLSNVSCVPKADRNTIAKIFGSVSEDGQTVSGLSGSSLAELIVKPSLKSVPVFSLEGNITKDFQHSFIRVLSDRGVKAVLKTNQGNQETYLAMSPISHSVSRYERLRPADHSTQYDHQQILIMGKEPFVKQAATFLYEKHQSDTSVYIIEEGKPKLIHGESHPLTEESTLVLVGKGERADSSGEMTLSGYTAQDVAKIISKTFRVSDQIKTTDVVASEVLSDKTFIETLLRELNEASIETEVHLRDVLPQVRHGEEVFQEISTDGVRYRGKDKSKKKVANRNKKGYTILREEPVSKREDIFKNEKNLLMPKDPEDRFKVYRDEWPTAPKRFIDQNIFEQLEHSDRNALDELEALSWAFFHAELPPPEKINTENMNPEEYYLTKEKITINGKKKIVTMERIVDEQELRIALSNCYKIKSGEDVRKVIRHYAKKGEDELTYLLVKDWIFRVNHQNLYIAPVGKKLDQNQIGNELNINKIKDCIDEHIKKEKYPDIREGIRKENINPEKGYAKYVKDIFLGEPTSDESLSTEAWYATYFTASIISESTRNFRTFPLVLMALDMVNSPDQNIQDNGLNFLFEEHSMARGFSWIDPSRRGFSGSATPEGSSKLENRKPRSKKDLIKDLKKLITREVKQYKLWIRNRNDIGYQVLDIAKEYKIIESNSVQETNKYNTFKTNSDVGVPSTSGVLGGYNDGHVTSQDPQSASELENSFKLESYFSRVRVLSATEIHSKLRAEYGENLAGLKVQEGSTRIENGQFISRLFRGDEAEPVPFSAELSQDTQRYNERMNQAADTALLEMESHGSTRPHQGNKYVPHAGMAVGALGLVRGMKDAVIAFEEGDIKDGVVGSLQTAHGVTAMTTSVIARQTLSSRGTRITRAATKIMRSPAMKGIMTAVPIAGIGFGLYNFEQDLERGGALGYTDAVLDSSMVALDIIEIGVPEATPIIAALNLALSAVRMVIDDVYMGIQNELNNLPKEAGVPQKLLAVLRGFGKGVLHFAIDVTSFFYNWRYKEIEEGRRLVDQISDYHKYYSITKEQDGTTEIDFSGGDSSWNGGNLHFDLADQGESELCMDTFVSSNQRLGKMCQKINTKGSQDVILGLGESHQLEYTKLQRKVLMFIPAGSVTVISGYKAVSNSRYGEYHGNKYSNKFFAIQKAEDNHTIEVMLDYYYELYGEPGDDIFFLGPQRSYVRGSSGKDTYIIPENGGKTIINNYDPSKALDTLHFSVDYSNISVSKTGDDVVLMYEVNHTVTIEKWFSGEAYRHMNMMSGDGVLFEICSTVVSSVRLVARGINKMFMVKKYGEFVNASQPLLSSVTHIVGSQKSDTLIGNGENNLIDGGGGGGGGGDVGFGDYLSGGEGEDIYIVKHKNTHVWINNYSRDTKIDLLIIEANFHTFNASVMLKTVLLTAYIDNTKVFVSLLNWFDSPAHRHLLVVTKDLITFTISDNPTDCWRNNNNINNKCIRSRSIDYTSSQSPLVVDLEKDEAFESVTEVRGSKLDDDIRGNKGHNVIVPGEGNDFIQGRGGEDWYVVTPGQGVKTINNQSPDLAVDFLFLKEQYQHITCTCDGNNISIGVDGRKDVILQNWFDSKNNQHLQIKTSDGITARLIQNQSSCGESLMIPITVDNRKQKPEPPYSLQKRSITVEDDSGRDGCFTYRSKGSEERVFCDFQGKVMMMMNNLASVNEMYGSSGFDIMVGNSNNNQLDPYTGGAFMFGGEGKDTYIIKHGYGNKLMIDNFAEDQNIDTVLVDFDYLEGGQIKLTSSKTHLNVTIRSKRETLKICLLNYNIGSKHQHLEFLSSDGVNFKLKSLNQTGHVPSFHTEAYKVTLKQTQNDCRLDLHSQRNLSKVHTVQGCPSQSNDVLGNNQDNALIGGWKDDALEGGQGDDTLIGGNGNDILIGGLGDDTLYGEDGNDTMMGNSGRDVFIPGPGADLVDGGPGRDTVLYRGDHNTGKGVYVNLLTGQGHSADAEGDVLKDVETVIGTIYSDILVTGYESALLQGSDGNDILVSTGGDYLVGGDGSDIYMLAFHHGSVTIDNCAKDNATDVLYLGSQSELPLFFDCQLFSDKALLTFVNLETTVKVSLAGWISDDDECGHLKVFNGDMEESMSHCYRSG